MADDVVGSAGREDAGGGTHDLGMWFWLSLGHTPAGPEVWNAIRALDYLETWPEVDSKRVAVTGISGGGAGVLDLVGRAPHRAQRRA